MGHSRSTADRWNNLSNKMKAASKAHDTVSSLLSNGCSSSKVAKEQDHIKTFAEGEPKPEERSEKSCMDDKVTLVSGLTGVIPSDTSSWGSMRRHWSKDHTDKIRSVSGPVIPRRTAIIRKLRSNPLTNDMVQIEGAERAYQKVKHIRRNHQLQNTKCAKWEKRTCPSVRLLRGTFELEQSRCSQSRTHATTKNQVYRRMHLVFC